MKTVKVGFLMGLGIGLMLSALIMFTISVAELNGQGTKNNYPSQVTNSENKVNDTISDTDLNKDKVVSENSNKTDNIKSENVTSNTLPTTKPIEQDKTEKVDKNIEYVNVEIPKGSDSLEVTKILFENEIISDKHDFNKYLEENDLTTKLSYGSYKLIKNSSYTDIIKQLTK